MNQKRLLECTRQLERDIADAVNALIRDYRAQTELSPKGVYCHMADITSLGPHGRRYVVSAVDVDVTI